MTQIIEPVKMTGKHDIVHKPINILEIGRMRLGCWKPVEKSS